MGECRAVRRRGNIILSENFHDKLFQSIPCPSVERTFRNLLYTYGRGRRRCGDPTLQADSFPLVGNAHRAFRGGKRVHVPSCRATVKHEIEETSTHCKFQSLQCPSVERTFRNLLYIYGRGRRRCGGPTLQADSFPLVGNAHRAFRGGKRGRMTFVWSTDNHKIDEIITV